REAGGCFFFQAEDAIRDDLVTGVQTCALPICLGVARRRAGGSERPARVADRGPRRQARQRGLVEILMVVAAGRRNRDEAGHDRRSEERRVGKEWESRTVPPGALNRLSWRDGKT